MLRAAGFVFRKKQTRQPVTNSFTIFYWSGCSGCLSVPVLPVAKVGLGVSKLEGRLYGPIFFDIFAISQVAERNMSVSLKILTEKEIDMYPPVQKFITSMHEIGTDFVIWKLILDNVVVDFEKESDSEIDLLSSIFEVYDFDSSTGKGELTAYKRGAKTITTKNISVQKDAFFRWIMNLSIPRVYNAIEILLLSAVMDEYFNKELDLKKFKTQQGEMNRAIRDYFDNNSLGRYESKNNRHILKYLGHKSAEINNFLNQNVRVDLNVNWQQFFEFISILRNVVTHNGMMMSKDVINQINSNAESLYGKYFSDSTY
ncbi:MAG: hypothetical protein IPJ82_13450 [Lewinellaceae bacterium]|nr:hypothetical protein [Lewinellaceae bacterium]